MTRSDNGGTHTAHWGTPDWLFDAIEERMQLIFDANWVFNLDPCARDKDVAKCPLFFTPEQDGLNQMWSVQDESGGLLPVMWGGGTQVFLNPPYGRGIKAWMKKAGRELDNHNCRVIAALLPASVGTVWFHEYVLPYATHIMFVKNRVPFIDYTNVGNDEAANFDSIVVYMVPSYFDKFCEFSTLEWKGVKNNE